MEGGKPEKNPWNRTRTNNKLSSHDSGPELDPGLIGGRQALSTLCHSNIHQAVLISSFNSMK